MIKYENYASRSLFSTICKCFFLGKNPECVRNNAKIMYFKEQMIGCFNDAWAKLSFCNLHSFGGDEKDLKVKSNF